MVGKRECGQPRAAHEPAKPQDWQDGEGNWVHEPAEPLIPAEKIPGWEKTRHVPEPEPSVDALALIDQLCPRGLLPEASRVWAARLIEAWRVRQVEAVLSGIRCLRCEKAEADLAAARERLVNCGQENCMGWRLPENENWVKESLLIAVRERIRVLEEALRGMLDQPETTEAYDAMMERARAALAPEKP